MCPHTPKGMLQGFGEEGCLFETDEFTVANNASCKAAEFAMLGLAEEANSIMSLLGAYATVKYQPDLRLEFFWAESDKPRPAGVPPPSDVTGTYIDDFRSLQLQNYAMQNKNRLPFWSYSEESFHELSKVVENETQGRSTRVTDATEGAVASKLSDAYTALLSIALHLGWQEKIGELMATIALRIHASMQSQRLGTIRAIWRMYLLSGWLRDAIGVDLQALREYASFVHDTTERRLKNGPLHPHSLYKDWTIRQIVEEIDRNTVKGMQNQSKGSSYCVDASEFFDGAIPSTIRREPATPEQIADAESRIGRALPTEVKEFYSVTDGFHLVKCESDPADFAVKLLPLARVYFEDDDWMSYPFELVSDFTLDFPWPPTFGGGIAIYDGEFYNHSGVVYTWIVGSDLVAKAKDSLWAFYETASDERKLDIDRKIARQFGSREVLDEISECCVYEQEWGANGRAHPTFLYYLESLAVKTRDSEERSPLKSEYVESDVPPRNLENTLHTGTENMQLEKFPVT